jgi:DNA polymerase, archaea type
MADGSGAYNRYYGKLNTGEMKIRGVMARKGDTPEYVRRMQQELFDVLCKACSQEELRETQPLVQDVHDKYILGLDGADVRELAFHRRLSRVSYSRRCAEASAVKAYHKRGFQLSPGMEIGFVVKDAAKWEVDTERDASEFDAVYYKKLLDKAKDEVAFVFKNGLLG